MNNLMLMKMSGIELNISFLSLGFYDNRYFIRHMAEIYLKTDNQMLTYI